MILGDFFSPEAGQQRRAWLNSVDDRIDETLAYYLGPQLMPRVRGAVGAANELTDFADYRDAVLGADQMASGATTADRIAGAGTMATGLAAMMVPGVSARMAEGVTDAGADLARFLADEDGGIRVWHGSPHDFDKFSMDKIGTGEGAQAYGHGLYFAESPDVARAYRDMGGDFDSGMTISGKDIQEFYNALENSAARMPIKSASAIYDRMALLEDLMGGGDVLHIREQAANGAYSPETLAWFEKNIAPNFKSVRPLYEVDLHANPEDFLDWDAPLSAQPELARRLGLRTRSEAEITDEAYALFEQYGPLDKMPPEVRARIEALNDEMNLPGSNQTGRELYEFGVGQQENVHDLLMGPSADRNTHLMDAGIPGIRYLDQGSRGAGDGTRNYVVFDENIIEIVKKYGIAGAAAMLGLSAADVQAQIVQQPVSISRWLEDDDTATLQEYLQ